jgi:hypothetical protein
MANSDTTQSMIGFPVFNYDPLSVTAGELCDQCMALSVAITELTNQQVRDTLNWILVDRLYSLRLHLVE